MLGQGITPQDYNPMADKLTDEQLANFMADVRQIIERAVAGLPSHADYIEQHCRAN